MRKLRYNSLDLLRIVSAISVIVIHINWLFLEKNEGGGMNIISNV